MCQKRRKKRTCQHSRLRGCIDITTRRQHKKVRSKTDCSYQKQYRQHKHQQNKNNYKKKMDKKQLYGHFKRQTSKISHQKTWTWLRKGHLNRETETILRAAQNNTIKTNYVKVRINKTQQNSRCRWCGDRDETINHIISEYSKLAQREYKTRHDWVGKVIHKELCKKFKFDHTNNWHIYNSKSVLENETQTALGFWDTNGSSNYGQTTRPSDSKKKKKVNEKKKWKKENQPNNGLCRSGWPKCKTERKGKER